MKCVQVRCDRFSVVRASHKFILITYCTVYMLLYLTTVYAMLTAVNGVSMLYHAAVNGVSMLYHAAVKGQK